MSLYALFTRPGPNGLGYRTTADEATEGVSLAGKTILLTGCNSGIGLEALRTLARRGARVVATARTVEKAKEAFAAAGASATAIPLACELSDPKSVRACVDEVKRQAPALDAILCNAGVMALPKREQAFGIELQFFTNHIGHFLLVTGLLDRLTDDGRVVLISSEAHRQAPREGIRFDDLSAEKRYSPWMNYGQSKLANLLFAKELARRFAGTRRTANAVHPGVIATNLTRHMNPIAGAAWAALGPLVLKTAPQGAATGVYVVAHPDAAKTSGEYWSNCNVARPRADANDPALAARLWAESERIVAGLPSVGKAA